MSSDDVRVAIPPPPPSDGATSAADEHDGQKEQDLPRPVPKPRTRKLKRQASLEESDASSQASSFEDKPVVAPRRRSKKPPLSMMTEEDDPAHTDDGRPAGESQTETSSSTAPAASSRDNDIDVGDDEDEDELGSPRNQGDLIFTGKGVRFVAGAESTRPLSTVYQHTHTAGTSSDEGSSGHSPQPSAKPRTLARQASLTENDPAFEAQYGLREWNDSDTLALQRAISSSANAVSKLSNMSADRLFWGDGLFDLPDEADHDTAEFRDASAKIRASLPRTHESNTGLVFAEGVYAPDVHAENRASILVRRNGTGQQMSFRFTLNTAISEVVEEVLKELRKTNGDEPTLLSTDLLLRFEGRQDFISTQDSRSLSALKVVVAAARSNKNIALELVDASAVNRTFLRDDKDDERDADPTKRLIRLPGALALSVSKKGVSVLLETYNKESGRLLDLASKPGASLSITPVMQAAKAICFTLARVESPELRESLTEADDLCAQYNRSAEPDDALYDALEDVLYRISKMVQETIELFQRATNQHLLDLPQTSLASQRTIGLESCKGTFQARVVSMHRIPNAWMSRYGSFRASLALYYAGQPLSTNVDSPPTQLSMKDVWFPHVHFPDLYLDLKEQMCQLPREARLICCVHGLLASSKSEVWEQVGWVSIPLFDHESTLMQGKHFLGLWLDKEPLPHGTLASNMLDDRAPLVVLSVKPQSATVKYLLDSAKDEVDAPAIDVSDSDAAAKTESTDVTDEESRPVSRADRTFCRVTTPYNPGSGDELALCVGDVIEILEKKDDAWWRGRRHAQERPGWFPSTHVTVLEQPQIKHHPVRKSMQDESDSPHRSDSVESTASSQAVRSSTDSTLLEDRPQQFRAIYPFEAQGQDEVSLHVGDVVDIVRQPDDEWWLGRANGVMGWFPSSHVEAMTDKAPEELEAGQVVVAVHDFAPRHEDELEFDMGTEITVLETPEGGWWKGGIDGKEGWFPSSHVMSKDPPPTRPRRASSIGVVEGQAQEMTDDDEDVVHSDAEPDDAEEAASHEHSKPACSPDTFKAVFDYNPSFQDEVQLKAGQAVTVEQAPQGGWWLVRTSETSSGWVPSNYLRPTSQPVLRPRSTYSRASQHGDDSGEKRTIFVAVHAFSARHTDELSFKPGDTIYVLQRPDGGWWEGRHNGKIGWFPANHVRESIKPPSSIEAKASGSGKASGPLPENASLMLEPILRRDSLVALSMPEKKMLWMFRHALQNQPRALPKVAAAVPVRRTPRLSGQLGQLVQDWPNPTMIEALELLGPQHADIGVRAAAVEIISRHSDDALLAFLPQIVQAVKFEPFHNSALARHLLERAMLNSRVCHALFWLLRTDLDTIEFYHRMQLVMETLLNTCGNAQRKQFALQSKLVYSLSKISETLKTMSGEKRNRALHRALGALSLKIEEPIRLPLDPGVAVDGIELEGCKVFTSNAAPFKIKFKGPEGPSASVSCIFKKGDDLRQDAVAMQLVDLMDQLWLAGGLELNILTFRILPTDVDAGLIELVPHSHTLREIHTALGVAGSFNDRILCDWLRQHNPTAAEWERAHDKFLSSCAGYCVATYVLGVGDRHNDNIMVCRDGRLFHIDFGRFLGNAQKFGSMKRDRVPFVLTPDMAYVINQGDKGSTSFQRFVDLCCQAYNILRHNARLLVNLLALMLNTGIPELRRAEDLDYVRQALRVDADDDEAAAAFTKMIHTSLQNRFTRINFFLHNLGQLKGPGHKRNSLSFSDGNQASARTDGRIRRASIVGFEKRRASDGNKFYAYVIEVERCDGSVNQVFRRFSEFHELNSKLSAIASIPLPPFPSKKFVGRSHVRQVAERRQVLLNEYLRSLLELPPAVSEHQLVYSFLHVTQRDRHDIERSHSVSSREREPSMLLDDQNHGYGRVKLAIRHDQAKKQLFVHVQHAQVGTPALVALGTADPYVKTYILPARARETKRKTTIRSGTLNPSYNETLTYDNIDGLGGIVLEVSLWSRDRLGGKQCLGSLPIDLSSPHTITVGGQPEWVTLEQPMIEPSRPSRVW